MVQFGPIKRGNMLLMPMNREIDKSIYLGVKHLPEDETKNYTFKKGGTPI
jgi:hypothetical protein